MTGRVVGNYKARPGVVYPYYESGRESYAELPALRVLPRDDTLLIPRGR